MNEKNLLKPAAAEENRAAHALPSTLVNRFHLTAGTEIMRITFGEEVSQESGVTYHQSVTLPRAEAVLMAQMILEMYRTKGEAAPGTVQ